MSDDKTLTYDDLRELLEEIAGCGISSTADGKYHEVQIPIVTWNAITEAVNKLNRYRWRSVKDDPPPVGPAIILRWKVFQRLGWDWDYLLTRNGLLHVGDEWMEIPE